MSHSNHDKISELFPTRKRERKFIEAFLQSDFFAQVVLERANNINKTKASQKIDAIRQIIGDIDSSRNIDFRGLSIDFLIILLFSPLNGWQLLVCFFGCTITCCIAFVKLRSYKKFNKILTILNAMEKDSNS